MTRLVRPQQHNKKDYQTPEDSKRISIPQWLYKVSKVVHIDTGEEFNIDWDCRAIYGYLFGYGVVCGFNNIYPNQDAMSVDLAIPQRTLKRKIKILSDSGLIDIIKSKTDKGGFYKSNRYRVNKACRVSRRVYFDVNGGRLTGSHYDWGGWNR